MSRPILNSLWWKCRCCGDVFPDCDKTCSCTESPSPWVPIPEDEQPPLKDLVRYMEKELAKARRRYEYLKKRTNILEWADVDGNPVKVVWVNSVLGPTVTTPDDLDEAIDRNLQQEARTL